MKERARLLVTLFGVGLSAIAVVALLRSVDVSELLVQLRRSRPGWFAAACLVTLLGYYFRARRWGVLLAPTRTVPTGRLFNATIVGFLAINTLPARLGELVRVYILARTERISSGTVLATVVMERFFDLAALGVFWALSLLFAPYPAWFRWSGYLTLALAVVLAGALWAFHRGHARGGAILDRFVVAFPERFHGTLSRALASFSAGLRVFGRPSTLFGAGMWSAVMWVTNGVVFLLTAECVGIDLPLWAPLLLAFVVCVAILIPSSPGFVGVLEGSCVIGLALLGVQGPKALAYGVLYHLTQLLPLVLLGGALAVRGRWGREVLSGAPDSMRG